MSNVGKNLLKFEQGNLIYSIPISSFDDRQAQRKPNYFRRENNVRPMYIERL